VFALSVTVLLTYTYMGMVFDLDALPASVTVRHREGGERQVDVSHRGGLPGFMRVEPDGVLTAPEFPGNTFYNTLGNFLLNPRAGLWCADFRTGDVLQMTGDVRFGSHGDATFVQAEQYWQFVPRRIVRRRKALRQRWTLFEDGWSPNSLDMGTWEII